VSHMTQGASRGPRVNIAARPQHHHGGAVHCSYGYRFGGSRFYEPRKTIRVPLTGKSTSPGEDSTGAGAERELGFDPPPKAELAQGEYKGAREVLARHVHAAEARGGPGGR
jgi:hypothetical protein